MKNFYALIASITYKKHVFVSSRLNHWVSLGLCLRMQKQILSLLTSLVSYYCHIQLQQCALHDPNKHRVDHQTLPFLNLFVLKLFTTVPVLLSMCCILLFSLTATRISLSFKYHTPVGTSNCPSSFLSFQFFSHGFHLYQIHKHSGHCYLSQLSRLSH